MRLARVKKTCSDQAFSRDIHQEVFEATGGAVAQGVTHRD